MSTTHQQTLNKPPQENIIWTLSLSIIDSGLSHQMHEVFVNTMNSLAYFMWVSEWVTKFFVISHCPFKTDPKSDELTSVGGVSLQLNCYLLHLLSVFHCNPCIWLPSNRLAALSNVVQSYTVLGFDLVSLFLANTNHVCQILKCYWVGHQ